MLTHRLVGALPAAFIFAALALSSPGASAQESEDTFRFGFSLPLEVIDPYYTGTREITMVAGEMAFDTLIYRDPETFQHKPLLATDWRWIDDVTLELDLRQGVTWHDGTPFTAEDVKYTFDYTTDPENKVWRPSWSNWIAETEILDPHKVRLHLRAPFGPALEYLAQVLPILPQDFYGEGGRAGATRGLIGTGPYRIVQFEPGRGVTFEINRDYFEGGPKGTPTIGRMEFRNLPDPATQIAELVSGGIDWMWRVPPEHLDNLAGVPNIEVATGGTMRIFWFGFDAEGRADEHFQDVRVRRAVAHALDRAALARELIGPETEVLDVPCYPTQLGCIDASQVTRYEYDPEKAKELLAEAGYPDGFDTTIYIYDQGPNRVLAEAIQGYLRAVGIRADLNVTTIKVFFESVEEGKVPLKMESYGQYNINDVAILLPDWFAGGSRDSVKDPQLIAWMEEAGSISDADRRQEIYDQAVKHIMDQAYWVPLFIQNVHYAYSSDFDFKAWTDENPRFYMAKWK